MTRIARSRCATQCQPQCQPHCPTHMPNAMPTRDARTDVRTDLRRIFGHLGDKSQVSQRARRAEQFHPLRGRITRPAAIRATHAGQDAVVID